MLTSFDHALIAVRDLEAAAADYERMLGRRRSWRGVHPDLGTGNALFKLDNTYLELLSPQPESRSAENLRAQLEEKGEGLLGLAFHPDYAGNGFFLKIPLFLSGWKIVGMWITGYPFFSNMILAAGFLCLCRPKQ